MEAEVPVIEDVEETYREDGLVVDGGFHLVVVGTKDAESIAAAKGILIDDGRGRSSSHADQEHHLRIAIDVQIGEL